MRCGVVAIDTRGRITLLNPEARRILDCADPGRLGDLGRDSREVLAARPQVPRILREALDGRERPGRAELVLRVRGGGRGPTIGFTVVAVRDPAGAVRGSVLFFRELAPFEPQEERDRLRDRLEGLGRMAAGLAHEIRSPLAAMEVLRASPGRAPGRPGSGFRTTDHSSPSLGGRDRHRRVGAGAGPISRPLSR
jgi:signal transduction histidine kinase